MAYRHLHIDIHQPQLVISLFTDLLVLTRLIDCSFNCIMVYWLIILMF